MVKPASFDHRLDAEQNAASLLKISHIFAAQGDFFIGQYHLTKYIMLASVFGFKVE